jgi:outer membrane protein assembly factor BamD
MLNFRFILLFLVTASVLFSCSDYNKLLKSEDMDLKLDKGIEFFEAKKYDKAMPLLEEVVASGKFRGTEKAEKLYYTYAYCHYYLKEFYLAAYYFKMFSRTFPRSRYAEECLFMSAMCNVKNSPKTSLDQAETKEAINEIQLFLNRYPESPRRDTCNKILDQLNNKLETKAFDNAALYYKIENYKAASIALKSMLEEYPMSRYKEEAMFMIVNADFRLAENSIDEKKVERYEQTQVSCTNFIAAYPESKHRRAVDEVYASAQKNALDFKAKDMYLKIKTEMNAADKAPKEKKLALYAQVSKSCSTFVSLYPESDFRKEVDAMNEEATKQIELLKP